MYPKWTRALLMYFNFCGFFTQFDRFHRFDQLIFVLNIILASVTTLIIVKFLCRSIGDQLGTVNDSLKLCALLILYWLSILELFSKRKTQRQFWDCLQRIDKEFCCHQNLRFRAYLLKISIYFSLFVSMFINYFSILFSKDKSEMYYFWFCFFCVAWFRLNQFSYYLFHLEFVLNELKMINREVDKILEVCKLKNAKVFLKEFNRSRLKWIREFYGTIHEMCDVINAVFGWSIENFQFKSQNCVNFKVNLCFQVKCGRYFAVISFNCNWIQLVFLENFQSISLQYFG